MLFERYSRSLHFDFVYWFPDGSFVEGKTVQGGWYWFNDDDYSWNGPLSTEHEASKRPKTHSLKIRKRF